MDEAPALPLDAETKVSERPSDHKRELRLWLRLFTCATLIEGEVRRRLRDSFNMTLPRFDLMAQLDKTPAGMKLGELSQRLMVSNGNITGLVERQAAPNDRRAQLVKLSPEGRRTFRSMAASHESWIAEAFGDLSPGDIDTLMRLLAKAKASTRKTITRRAQA